MIFRIKLNYAFIVCFVLSFFAYIWISRLFLENPFTLAQAREAIISSQAKAARLIRPLVFRNLPGQREHLKVPGLNDGNPPSALTTRKINDELLENQKNLPRIEVHSLPPMLAHDMKAIDPSENGSEDWVEVSKNKTYETVKFPVFVEYGRPGDPGENGARFELRKEELTEEERKQKKADFDQHFFDEWISRRIAVHRSLPDDRAPECKVLTYGNLPKASVLIVFYNEAWTTLLRSIHSILDRTPPHLLLEIVLLDDFSDMDHLKEPLEAYLKPLEKVKLFRAKKRLGLIRARNMAFELSRGDIVVFLDSHIECFPGWLEPLLDPIYTSNRTVTFPIIENINDRSFSLYMAPVKRSPVGGLDLDYLNFVWLSDRKTNATFSSGKRPSPTMPGGLYAISRDFFKELGLYDPEMDLWGGENIEISFKAWMCGGSILLVSCSHVGHVFRHNNPTVRNVTRSYKNMVRVAEVWMDQYKHYFYEKIAYNVPDFGDVSDRVQLRKSLQCQDFGWYLQTVFPELKEFIELHSIYAGQIRNDEVNLCLNRHLGTYLDMQPCQEGSIFQNWNLYKDGTIASGKKLLGIKKVRYPKAEQLALINFPGTHADLSTDVIWIYDDKQRLIHKRTGLCLHALHSQHEVVLMPCLERSAEQMWKITTREEWRDIFRKKGVPIEWSV